MMGVYLRGPHLGPLRSGVRLSGRSRGGSGCATIASLALVAGLVITYPWAALGVGAGLAALVVTLAVVGQRRRARKPADYWAGLDKVAEELRHATPEQRAAARAAVPDLTGSGWHHDDHDFLVRDELPS
jgi:hypothetical protein